MNTANRTTHRRRLAIGAIVAMLLGGLATFFWPRPERWPSRVEFVPADPIRSIPNGFSADGRSFLTADFPGLTVWDASTGQRRPIPTEPLVLQESFSQDRRECVRTILSAHSPQELARVDVESGRILARTPIPVQPSFPPIWTDGDQAVQFWLALPGGDIEVATWDLTSDSISRRPLARSPALRGPKAVSPDGRLLACEDLIACGVQLWDVATDQPVGSLLKSPTVALLSAGTGLTFSRDGQTLIVGQTDGTVEFWDVNQARFLKSVRVHPSNYMVWEVVLAPDGLSLASTGSDYPSSLLEQFLGLISLRGIRGDYQTAFLDLASDQILARVEDSSRPRFAPDGRTVVSHQPYGKFSVRAYPPPAAAHQ